jgi:hypothetical protein
VPWKTWREKQRAEEAAWSWRELISESSTLVGVGLALIIGAVGGVLALTVGINLLAAWIVGALVRPPLPALIGFVTILLAAWGLVRIATGRSQPGTSRRNKIIAIVGLSGVALIGLAVVVYSITRQGGGSPSF